MEKIEGISIKGFSLENYRKVSDLIFFEGPLLSHFLSDKEENFLFSWVDSDEDFNRWFVFRVSQEKLIDYLNGKITLLSFFLDPIDGFLYKIDVNSEGGIYHPMLLYPDLIPKQYLPSEKSFYSFIPENNELDLSFYSKKHKTGVLQAYFQNSSKVPYNEIEFGLFAKSLFEMNLIFEAMSNTYLKIRVASAPKDEKGRKIIDRQLIKKSTQLNYFGQAGGSFSALFKSSVLAVPIQGVKSDEDSFIEFLMSFLRSSEELPKLSESVQKLDKKILIHYKNLLNTIISSKLNFFIKYENYITDTRFKQNLGFRKAGLIVENLEKLEYSLIDEIRAIGRFTAINIRTGTYTFEELGGNEEVSKGKFDKERKEMSWLINFNKNYEVLIKREEMKPTGAKDPKKIDSIISFVPIENSSDD